MQTSSAKTLTKKLQTQWDQYTAGTRSVCSWLSALCWEQFNVYQN